MVPPAVQYLYFIFILSSIRSFRWFFYNITSYLIVLYFGIYTFDFSWKVGLLFTGSHHQFGSFLQLTKTFLNSVPVLKELVPHPVVSSMHFVSAPPTLHTAHYWKFSLGSGLRQTSAELCENWCLYLIKKSLTASAQVKFLNHLYGNFMWTACCLWERHVRQCQNPYWSQYTTQLQLLPHWPSQLSCQRGN